MDRLIAKQKMIERLQNKLNRKNNNADTTSGDNEEHIEGYDKPTTPFRPFNEKSINFDDDQFDEEEDDHEDGPPKIDESLLTRFVNNLLTNQALALAYNKAYHEDFDGNTIFGRDQIPNVYKITPASEETSLKFDRTPRKKTRPTRQGRGKKSSKQDEEEDSEDSAMSDFPPGSHLNITDNALMINVPVDMFRQFINNELEQKLWFVNLHYRREWETINRERIITLAELVKLQEINRKVKKQHDEMKETLKIYKEQFGEIVIKQEETNNVINTNKKEGKRRRRLAKKQRKIEKVPTSQSEIVSGESDRDPDQTRRAKSQDSAGDE